MNGINSMSAYEKEKLDTYKELSSALVNSTKDINIVMSQITGKIYMKKALPGTGYYLFFKRLIPLNHRNLVKVADVVCYEDTTYVFEEYTSGQTLQSKLENEGLQSEKKVVDYVMQICDALDYLHSQEPPIIHRDIKPENIILTTDDIIKLFDFDIAREYKESARRDTVFMGTKEYAAPEQYGFKQTDGRTDIYALGVLLHELLTGKLPENNISYQGSLRKVILKCLRLEPGLRYQSVAALKKALMVVKFYRFRKPVAAAAGLFVIITGLFLFQRIAGNDVTADDGTSSASGQLTEIRLGEAVNNIETAEDIETAEGIRTAEDIEAAENIGIVENSPAFTLTEQDLTELMEIFARIDAYEVRPAVLLEQTGINQVFHNILGNQYDEVVKVLQEFEDLIPCTYVFNEATGIEGAFFGLVTCNYDAEGNVQDHLILYIYEGEMYVAHCDADKDAVFYYGTIENNMVRNDLALSMIYSNMMVFGYDDSPFMFGTLPESGEDIKGSYSIGYKKKIDVFEEAGEMKFSYTDTSLSDDARPLMTETIYKWDDYHYWLDNTTYGYGGNKVFFDFSADQLIILKTVYEPGADNDMSGLGMNGIYEKMR